MTVLRALLALAASVGVLLAALAVLHPDDEAEARLAADQPVEAGPPDVLLVVDAGDRSAAPAAAHVRVALTRARVPFVEHDLATGRALPPLDSLRAVLTATEMLRRLGAGDVRRLATFVDGGGGLAVLYRARDPRLDRLLGVVPRGAGGFDPGKEPLVLTEPLMPGGGDLRLAPGHLSSLALGAAPECDVFAERSGGKPAAWTCARGAGRVAFWNTATLPGKPFRGHILQTLALVHPAHVRPVAGWATVYLDDFPSPASNDSVEPIWTAHGETPAKFYARRWYPDMVSIAERYGLQYTSTVIYSYNGRTRPPFDLAEWLVGRADYLGTPTPYSPLMMARDAERSEMALHGYNHEPLRLKVWGDRAPMVRALGVARRRWDNEDLAPMPTTYVPPMNQIDSVGVTALREVFPEVDTIAGLYFGPASLGQDREFGPEPWDPALYALPRNTAGYAMSDEARLSTLTLLHTVGAWSHFVHPDDVYPNADRTVSYRGMGLADPAETGWEGPGGLKASFERWVGFVKGHYPWLDGVTAAEAARRMRRFDGLSLAWTPAATDGGRTLAVALSQPGQTVLTWARPGERLAGVDSGTVLDVWEGGLLTQYAVRVTGLSATLRFRSSTPT